MLLEVNNEIGQFGGLHCPSSPSGIWGMETDVGNPVGGVISQDLISAQAATYFKNGEKNVPGHSFCYSNWTFMDNNHAYIFLDNHANFPTQDVH